MKFSHTTGGRITFKSINVINGIVRVEHKGQRLLPAAADVTDSTICYEFPTVTDTRLTQVC